MISRSVRAHIGSLVSDLYTLGSALSDVKPDEARRADIIKSSSKVLASQQEYRQKVRELQKWPRQFRQPVNLTVSQIQSWADPVAMRTMAQGTCECDAQAQA